MGVFKRLLGAFIRRPSRNWNVENRAHKLIDKHEKGAKPAPAPQFPSSRKQMDDIRKENPEVLNIQKEKNDKLHQMLEGMVVNPDKLGEVQSRRLPEDRSKVADHEFGYQEPAAESVPVGRCTIRQSLEFITAHQSNPQDMSSQVIAKQYKLDSAQVQQILKYFQTLQLTMPKGMSQRDLSPDELDFSKTPKKVITDKGNTEKPVS